jgi:hypothetical protein
MCKEREADGAYPHRGLGLSVVAFQRLFGQYPVAIQVG